MKTSETKIDKLKLAEYNPRKISEKDLGSLKRSLKKFGFIQPVVINKDFTVVSGHQRIRAWKEMGNEEVPTIQLQLTKTEEKALKNSTKYQDNVIDLFGGSGSCLIACEKMGRNAFIMELDPRFVDVIIYRWEKYTGKKAKKI